MDVKFNQAVNAYTRAATATTNNDDTDATGSSSGSSGAQGLQPSFKELVSHSLEKAKVAGYSGESISAAAIAGKAELHELVTAITNAELTLQTVVAVRDKAVGAYQDIIKMPI